MRNPLGTMVHFPWDRRQIRAAHFLLAVFFNIARNMYILVLNAREEG